MPACLAAGRRPMFDTRRSFIQAAVTAAGVLGVAAPIAGQAAAPQGFPGAGTGAGAQSQQPAGSPRAASEVQSPQMKFGSVEISRLVCGCNTFYGFAHFNQTLGLLM